MMKPMWIILLASFVIMFVTCAYIYRSKNSTSCNVFSYRGCKPMAIWLPPVSAREYTDDEIALHVVFRDILNSPVVVPKNPNIAFMFFTPGSLPFEKLLDNFFHVHEGKFSIYVHASKTKPVHQSHYFVKRDIRSDQVVWGKLSMVDVERRLLSNALQDPNNQHFILFSDSCVPLYNFDYIFDYLMYTNISFVECFRDPGPVGNGRC